MTTSNRVLQNLVGLTSLKDLEQLEAQLVQILSDVFEPESIALVAMDQRGDVRASQWYDRSNGHTAAGSASGPRLSEATDALRAAQDSHDAIYREGEAGCYLAAFPLVDSHPCRTGTVLVFPRSVDPRESFALERLLHIYRNFCQMIEDSQRDELTGLLNRKTFDGNIHRIIGRAVELAKTLEDSERRATHAALSQQASQAGHWLAIIDVDHFKRINDEFGHLYGDEVLVSIAHQLRESFRDTDIIYRFGGEEFVIIMTSATRDGAGAALERFRQRLHGRPFPQVGAISISYGIAAVTPSSRAHSLLDCADQALYFAKRSGRNQGHFYEDLVDSGAIAPALPKVGEVELF